MHIRSFGWADYDWADFDWADHDAVIALWRAAGREIVPRADAPHANRVIPPAR